MVGVGASQARHSCCSRGSRRSLHFFEHLGRAGFSCAPTFSVGGLLWPPASRPPAIQFLGQCHRATVRMYIGAKRVAKSKENRRTMADLLAPWKSVTVWRQATGSTYSEQGMSSELSDSAETQRLLVRIRAGERAAFNELFDRHRGDLRRAVELRLDRRLRARVDASDIVQESHLEAYRRLDDYLERTPMPFGLWLRKTAQQQLLNHRRTHMTAARRSVHREDALPDQSSMLIAAPLLHTGPSPSRQAMKREYARLVSEAVNELAEIDREILLMRNVEGLTQQAIAQVLELSHDAVRQRYGRALIKLQRLLAAKGLGETDV